MRKLLIIIFLFLLVLPFSAENRFTVPYDVVGGKIRVEASINGNKKFFIFDTGGQTTISYKYFRELGLKLSDSIRITDSNSNKKFISTAKINSFSFADTKYKIADVRTLVLDANNSIFDCYDCDGLIGNDILSKFIIEIDSRTKTITFKTPDEPINISLRKMLKFNDGSVMPVFKVSIADGTLIDVLFDTGSKPLFVLKASEYDRLIENNAISEKTTGVGIETMGVNGIATSQPLKKAEISSFNIGMSKFESISTSVSTPPESLIGIDLLQYGKVTIDYSRSRFYFESFEDKVIKQTTKSWNIGLTVRDGHIFVSTLWGQMINELKVGDEVLEIDGISPQTTFCESITKGMSILTGKNEVTLKVKTANGIKTIVSTKE